MPFRLRHSTGLAQPAVVSWRMLAQRFSFAFFLFLSVGLLVIGHNKPVVIQNMRVRIVDGTAPVLDALSRPMTWGRELVHDIGAYFSLRAENERLRGQVSQLAHWQNMALALGNENKELRGLLKYKPEPGLAYISARVIGDTGGAYSHSLIITAGQLDGVRDGMAAMTGEGLIGRIVEVGDWSSRVLLLTDMNARIPVMIAGTGDHAILAGDNSPHPKLLYLPQDAVLRPGMRVLTSGHGGIFPPNLPVGIVVEDGAGGYQVTPLAAMGRVNQVRLVDFDLAGGSVNPLAAKVQSGATAPAE